MGFRLPGIVTAKRSLTRSLSGSKTLDIPKGYLAIYVGESQKRRFVIPVSYLNEPVFRNLLSQAEEEFGYDHPMGGITIPCSEQTFLDLTSCLQVAGSIDEEQAMKEKRETYLYPQASCEAVSWEDQDAKFVKVED